MNQADVTKLMSKLRINFQSRYRKLKNIDGPEGRLRKLRKTVTALIKHERLELYYNRADEARGYAERLISDAIRYGDCHRATMEMADYWLLEKQLIHKLFKVLVPRFENHPYSYTRMFKAPRPYPGHHRAVAVLEIRGNPYPALKKDVVPNNRNLIHNILLDEARKEYRLQKYAEIAQKLAASEAEQENVAEAATPEPKSEVLKTSEPIAVSEPKQEHAAELDMPEATAEVNKTPKSVVVSEATESETPTAKAEVLKAPKPSGADSTPTTG